MLEEEDFGMCRNWKLSEHHVRIYCCGQSEPIKWKISIGNQCWFSSLKHYLIFLWSPQGGSILTQRARQHLYPGLSWYMYCTLLDLSWYIYWTLPGFSWYMYLARINAEAVLCFPSQICFQSNMSVLSFVSGCSQWGCPAVQTKTKTKFYKYVKYTNLEVYHWSGFSRWGCPALQTNTNTKTKPKTNLSNVPIQKFIIGQASLDEDAPLLLLLRQRHPRLAQFTEGDGYKW